MNKSKMSTAIYGVVGAAFLFGSISSFADDHSASEIEEVIVTGSLITNTDAVRSTPIVAIEQEEMEYQGIINVEEMLREVPGMVPSVNANVNNGNGGFSYVNLRGLGSNRNLVLIDGNRYAPSELAGRFDLNNIPIALIDRIDVLTGGTSSTYGADAVAGVVNVVTKKSFTGLQVDADFGSTAESDGDEKSIEVTMGSELDGGRGNAVFSVGYRDVDPVFQGDRTFSEYVLYYWNGVQGGSGLGSYNTRIGNVNPTGADNGNLSLGGVQDDGTFAAAYTPFNYGPYNAFQTPLETYNIFSSVDYQISDSVEVYSTALFNENTVSTLIAPSGSFGDSVTVALNHPFLSDAQRNAICAFDTDPTEGSYVPRFSQAECDAAGAAAGPSDSGYRTFDTQMRRRNVEGGPRISDYVARYFNMSVGLRGDLNDNMSWDVMTSYGKSDQTQTQKGYWMKSRFRQSLLSGPDGCNDSSGGCVPVDFFGPTGSITADMNAFLQGGESNVSTIFDMRQLKGSIVGTMDYSLPTSSDNISFALAAEYREYTGEQASDILSQAGDLGGSGAASPNIYGAFEVNEISAEVVLPILEDSELAEELVAEAGVRYSDYSIDTEGDPSFSTTTWKMGLSWTPIDSLTVRANYAHAVRAPNISELFSPVITGLGNLTNDPCASVGDDGVSNGNVPTGAVRDVCIGQGAPAATIGFIPQPAAGQVNVTTGGNASVLAEESDSFTIGVIAEIPMIPGLTVNLDYYDFEITDAISTPTESDAIDLCFNNPSMSNPVCAGMSRSPIDGSLAGDESVVKGLPLVLTNAGIIATKGFDFGASYGMEFGKYLWTSSLAGNFSDSNTFQSIAGVTVNRECVGYYSSNCDPMQPEFAANFRNTVSFDNVDVSLNMRHISGMEFENQADDPAFIGETQGYGYHDFSQNGSYSIFDLSGRYVVNENITLIGVITNVFDKQPPLTGAFIGITGFNSGNTYPSTYDTLGRRFNISAKMSF
jgi:iron complex outermembrane receptor protein